MKGVINQVALVVFGVLAAATLLLAVFNDKIIRDRARPHHIGWLVRSFVTMR